MNNLFCFVWGNKKMVSFLVFRNGSLFSRRVEQARKRELDAVTGWLSVASS